MLQVLDRVAGDGRVGGDHAVEAVALQDGGHRIDLRRIEVGRDLHEDRHAAAVLRGELRLAFLHRGQQRVERGVTLQVAQILGVRARDVDGHVVGVRVHAVQAQQIVVDGAFDRRGRVLADVQAEDAAAGAEFRLLHVGQEGAETFVVETEPVDQRVRFGQAEHARLRIAALSFRRHGADLDETETHRRQAVDAAAVLVQAGGQADAVRELQARHRHRVVHARLLPQALQRRVLQPGQGAERQLVRVFGVEPEEERAGEGIGQE